MDLSSLDLDAVRQRHPAEWTRVSEDLLGVMAKGNPDAVAGWLREVKRDAAQWRVRVARSRQNPRVVESAFPHLLRERIAHLALQKTALAAATQQTHGTARLGRWSGSLIQLLFFSKGLTRKPVSLSAFRFWWRFVFDRKLLMPLVQPQGIYCFYSRELVTELAHHIDGRSCLELAAGDGTLSRFLRAAGVELNACDDGSWRDVTPGADVERLDARAALKQYAPKVVLCSWPPTGNRFERAVFETPSVELYVVIASRHAFASGDLQAWAKQRDFEGQLDERLTALVLPPELDPAVYVFRRRAD